MRHYSQEASVLDFRDAAWRFDHSDVVFFLSIFGIGHQKLLRVNHQ